MYQFENIALTDFIKSMVKFHKKRLVFTSLIRLGEIPGLAFDAACGQTADQVFLEGEEERHDGDGHENCTGGEEAVIGGLCTDILFEGNRQSVHRFFVHEGGGENEFVPRGHEGEESGDGDGRTGKRQDNFNENHPTRCAVHDGSFLEIFGNGIKISF